MLYDSYQKKMRKVAKFRNFVKRRRIPIIIISAIILITLVAFMSTKGAATNIEFESTSEITKDDNGNIVIEYGGEISAGSNALFASSHVEYLVNGQWTETAPSKPGEYTVRVVSENSFGGQRTGKEQTVIIASKKTDVTIKDVVLEYGTLPDTSDVIVDLVEGDELVDATFIQKEFNKNDCGRAVFGVEAIQVIDSTTGKDVTNEYYDFNYVDKELKLSPTKVNLDIKDLAKVFDDTEITEADYTISKGAIVNKDTILKLTYDGAKVGSQSKDATIKAVLDGIDITKLYDFNINVNRRDITVLSGSVSKEFNGSELSYAEFEILEGELAPNHKLVVSNSSKYINCGEYANIQDYVILDTANNNADVTDKYNISKNMGVITITKCDFDIELANLSFEYDGKPHSTIEYTLKNNRFTDEYNIVVETEGTITNVGEVEVTVKSWHVFLDGKNVDENFNPNIIKGSIKITKKALTITADDKEITYGSATPLFSVTGDGFVEGENITYLTGDAVFTCAYENDATSENRNVGTYDIIVEGFSSINYEIAYVKGSLNVTKKALAITANDKEIVYGAVSPNFDLTAVGFEYGENEESLHLNVGFTCTYASENDSDNRHAGHYDIIITGEETDNYEITYEDGDLYVSKKALTLKANDENIIYGSASPEFSISGTGFEYDESIESLGLVATYTCAYENTKDSENRVVGVYTITPSNVECADYDITFVEGSLNVTKKALIITADEVETIYGSPAPEFTLTDSGYVYDEDITYLTGDAEYECDYEAVKGSDNRHVKTYDIIVSGYSSDNYEITFTKGTLTVAKKALTITADEVETIYGSPAPEFTLTDVGYEYEEDITYLTGDAEYKCTYEAVNDSENRHVGTYDIIVSGYSSDDYEIEFITGSLNVTKKALTITADDKETVYGTAAPEFTLTNVGYVYDEDITYLTGNAEYECTYEAVKDSENRHVGTYDIIVSGYSSDDYEIEFITGSLNVTKKALTITAEDKETIYGSPAPEFTLTDSGYVYDEDITYLTGDAEYECDYEAVKGSENRHVKTYDIIVSGYSSDDYEIEFITGSLNVTKKALTITADDKETVYGTPAPEFTLTDVGYEYEEDITYLTGDAEYECTYEAVKDSEHRHVGTYDIIVSGYSSDDYEIEYIDGSLNVAKKALTITADDKETVYGSAAPEFTLTDVGYVYGEDIEDLDGEITYSCTYTATKDHANRHAGTYDIVVSGLASDDYEITFTKGTLTVTKKALTITADEVETIYGSPAPEFTLTDVGYVYDEDITYLTGDAEYECDYEAVKGSENRHVKTYDIIVSGYSSDDYEIEYIDGSLNVTKKIVRVTANDSTITYGDALVLNGFTYNDLDFVYDETSALVDDSELSITSTYDTSNEELRGAGEYPIVVDGLSAQDYDFNYINGTLYVLKKALTITADEVETIYGSPAPEFTLTDSGYVYDEDITYLTGNANYECTYDAVKGSDNRHVGTYDIIVSGYSSDNYEITFTKGTLTVTKKALTITAEDKETVYGSAAPEFTLTDVGYEYDEDITYLTGDANYECTYEAVKGSDNRHAGTYDILVSGLTSDNYEITFTKGTLTVAKKALTITADDKETVYGSAAPEFTLTDVGYVYDEDITYLTGDAVYECTYEAVKGSDNRHVGTYDIIVSGYSSNDYEIEYINGSLNVTKKALTITAEDKETIYGSPAPEFTLTDVGYVYDEDITYLTGDAEYECTYEAVKDSDNRHVGTYDIIVSGYSSDDYEIEYINGSLNVTKKALTVKVDNTETIYGSVAPDFSHTDTGYAYEEDASYLSGEADYTCSYEALKESANRHVGTYDITVTGLDSDDYNITYQKGTLTVLPKDLTITPDDKETVYGSAAPAFTSTGVGFVYDEGLGDLDDSLVAYTCTYVAAKESIYRHAGTYPISVTGYSNDDYNISYEEGSLNVNKKELIIKADNKATTYGSVAPAFTYTDSGYVYDEDINVLSGAIDYDCIYSATKESDNRHAGDYAITPKGFDSDDYEINYQNGTLSVAKKALNIQVINKEVEYGTIVTPDMLEYECIGFVYEEDESCLGGNLSVTTTYDTNVYAKRSVGVYPINVNGYSAIDYEVTCNEGELTVVARPFEIKVDDIEITYGDSAPTYTYTLDEFAFDEDQSYFGGETTLTCAYVGLYNSDYRHAGTYDINHVSEFTSTNYAISYVDGLLTVAPKVLTIKADDKTTSYGLDAPALTFTDTGYAYEENIGVLSGQVLYSCIYEALADSDNRHAGTYDIDVDTSTFANADYDINYVKGTLTVNKVALTITANDHTITYGDDESNNGYTISDAMFVYNDTEEVLEGEIEYSYTYDVSDKATRRVGNYTISISGLSAIDYNINYVDGTLTVVKKNLEIKADNKETIYGLDAPEFTKSSLDFAFDEDFSDLSGEAIYECAYSVENDANNHVGDYIIGISGFSADNYNINYTGGNLYVNKRPIKLHSDGATKVYDGTSLENENVEICEDTVYNLLDGHVLSITSVPSIKDAIARTNKMTLVVTSEDGLTDYTANYDLDTYYDAGVLEITRRKIKVTSATDEKDYDRTPLTNHNYVIELLDNMGEVIDGDGIVEYDIEDVEITGTITNVRYLDGEVVGRSNTISLVTIRNRETSDDVTSNYQITYEEGTLTINPRGIVISTGSADAKIYDDEYVQVEEYSVTFGNLPDGYYFDVTDFPRVKDAGTYNNIPTITIYDELDNVVDQEEFEITINHGKIVILPIVLNLKSESADQPYDGTPLRASDYGRVFGAPENKDVLAIHRLDASVVGEASEIGVWDNTISARIVDLEGNDIRREDNNELAYTIIHTRYSYSESYSNNYLIYLDEGELIIKDDYVRVEYELYRLNEDYRSCKVYDGNPFTEDLVYYRLYNIVNSQYVSFDRPVKLKIVLHDGIEFASAVGKYTLSKDDYDAYIVDEYDNILDYDVRYYDLNYRIYGEHELTIVGAYSGYTYDGMPHKAEDSDFEYFGHLEGGHTIEVHYTTDRTDLGQTFTDFEYAIYDAGHNNVTAEYTIDTVQAMISISERRLGIYFNSIEHVYDGQYVSANMEDITSITGLLSGHRVESILMDSSTIKDCIYLNGEPTSRLLRVFSFVVLDEDDNDVTRYYYLDSDCGAYITILPRDIKFTSDSVEKVYDGETLSGNISQVHYVEGLVDGDYYVISSMTGNQTDIGHTKNSFEFRVYDENDYDITGNYKLDETSELGSLRVKGIINITTGDVEKLYDGTQANNEYTYTGTLMEGYNPDVYLYSTVNGVYNVKRDNEGKVASYTDYVAKLIISNGLDDGSSYVITYQYDLKEDGTLYLRSTEEYSLKNKNYHLFKEYNEEGELINRFTKRYNYNGDDEVYVGTVAMKLDDFDYEVTTNAGTITINPRTIVVYSADAEFDYDGYTHYNDTLIPIIDLENEWYDLLPNHSAKIEDPLKVRFATLNEDGEVEEITNNAELSSIRVMNGMVDVTRNYEVLEYRPGTLKVNKRDLVITTHDLTKEFDGVAYFESDEETLYDAIGLAETDVLTDKLFGNIETSVGTYDFEMYFDILNLEVDRRAFDSYNIEYNLGKLTIEGDEFDLGDGGVINGRIQPEGGGGDMPEPTPYFDFTPSFDGVVYFRGRSYGDYISGMGYNKTVTQYKNGTLNPLEYQAIYNGASDTVYIDSTNGEYHSFVSTYYTNNDLSLFGDVYVGKSYKEPYTLNVYRGYPTALAGLTLQEEEAYRVFVYDNYLNLWLSQEFSECIDAIISEQGFDANDPDIIAKVSDYVHDSGKYNFFYMTEDGYDPVHYFLAVSHEGDAQIFTTAALLIYRRLGIPARYVTGFVKKGSAGVATTVTGFDGHAWLEVYKDGYGWIITDPTAQGGGAGGGSGMGGSGGSMGDVGDMGDHMGEGMGDGEGGGFNPQGGGLSNSMNYPNSEAEELVIFVVNTTASGKIYLKEQSYGNYTGQGFDPILMPYTSSYYNPMEYPAIAQRGTEEVQTIVIDMTQGVGVPELYRVIPYYISEDLTDFNDIFVYGDNTEAYSYNYIADNVDYTNPPQLPAGYAKYENAYRDYVYANYLSLNGMSDELTDLFDRIIAENGFDKNNVDIINDVAQYIRSAAVYDKSFEIPDDCEDFVYYFLAVSKTGVCQHYAASATMLYRYLGIPARWTTGFMVTTQAGIDTPIKGEYYHAWTEVYIDGFGWTPIEVTGSPLTNPFEIKVGYYIQTSPYTGAEFDFNRSGYYYNYTINKEVSTLPNGYSVVLELPEDYHFESESGTYTIYGSDYEAYVLNDKGQIDELYTSYIVKCDSEYTILEDNEIIIYPVSVEVIYDGKLHTLENYDVVGNLKPGHTVNVMFRTKAKDVGTYNVTYIYTIKDETSQDVSSQYSVTKKDGTIIINKAPIKIYFNDIHHEYDGKPVTLSMDAVNHVEGLLEGHSLVHVSSNDRFIEKMYDEFGEITYEPAYVSSFRIEDENGNDVSDYYSCVPNEMLEYNRCNIYIDSPTITIKPDDVYEYYDGKYHYAKSAVVDKGRLPIGYTIEAEFSGRRRDVGESISTIKEGSVRIYNQNSEDVTEEYIILLSEGIISLEKRRATVTAGVETTYDGSIHEAEFSVLSGDLNLDLYDVEYTITGARTDAGRSDAIITSLTIIDKSTGEDCTEYFDIEYVDGIVKVNPYAVTIKPRDRSKPYDGNPLTSNDVEYVTDMLEGYSISIVTDGVATSSGEYENNIVEYIVYNEKYQDVTSNFDVTCVEGILSISGFNITLTPRNQSFTYDGTIKYARNLIAKETDAEMDITVTAEVSGSLLNAGATDLEIVEDSVVIKDGSGNDITNQFKITLHTGTLTVKKRNITIKPEDVVGVYNGEEYSPSNYQITSASKLVDGHTAVVKYSGSLSTVGSINSSITDVKIIDENYQDVTGNYNITTVKGTITVE